MLSILYSALWLLLAQLAGVLWPPASSPSDDQMREESLALWTRSRVPLRCPLEHAGDAVLVHTLRHDGSLVPGHVVQTDGACRDTMQASSEESRCRWKTSRWQTSPVTSTEAEVAHTAGFPVVNCHCARPRQSRQCAGTAVVLSSLWWLQGRLASVCRCPTARCCLSLKDPHHAL